MRYYNKSVNMTDMQLNNTRKKMLILSGSIVLMVACTGCDNSTNSAIEEIENSADASQEVPMTEIDIVGEDILPTEDSMVDSEAVGDRGEMVAQDGELMIFRDGKTTFESETGIPLQLVGVVEPIDPIYNPAMDNKLSRYLAKTLLGDEEKYTNLTQAHFNQLEYINYDVLCETGALDIEDLTQLCNFVNLKYLQFN